MNNIFFSKNVAIVGNSNIIKNKNYSKFIDSHDIVVRFNFSEIIPLYTGSKTSYRFIRCPINLTSIKLHNKKILNHSDMINYIFNSNRNNKIICNSSAMNTFLSMNLFDKNKFIDSFSKFNDWNYLNNYLKYIGIDIKFDYKKNCWLRTGTLFILVCIDNNIRPNIFGFDFCKKKFFKHYDSNHIFYLNNISYHQINKEVELLNIFKKKNLINVY